MKPGKKFAGNNEFSRPWGVARSANITPDPDGLGDKTRDNFIGAVPKGAPNTIMAWALYNKLTDEDLGAIYNYLKIQSPWLARWKSSRRVRRAEPTGSGVLNPFRWPERAPNEARASRHVKSGA